MAASEEQFRVEIYAKETNDGESLELTYIIGKDEIAQLLVGFSFILECE